MQHIKCLISSHLNQISVRQGNFSYHDNHQPNIRFPVPFKGSAIIFTEGKESLTGFYSLSVYEIGFGSQSKV